MKKEREIERERTDRVKREGGRDRERERKREKNV